jgi:tetratricopeptide (TPR) repeat protein
VGVRLFNALEVTKVKAPHRSALSVAGLVVAFAATAVPSASAQRNVPGPDTRRVLITAFRGDAEGGVKLADELRNRVQSEFNIKTLMPTSKKDIDATLVQSGYKPDSALGANDIRELAKIVRGDEVIDGTVTRTPAGYRVNARFFLARDVALSQPLYNGETNNLGDAAKQIVSEYDRARKQLKANQECENAIREGKLPDAIAAARRGIAEYSNATISRLCLASAYQAMKTTADSTGPWKDSVIAVTRAITALDRTSRIAYQLQYDAFKAKNDTVNLVPALLGYMNSDPTNSSLRESVIAEVIQLGKAELAVPIAKQLVAENPGDPGYARTYYLVLGAARNYKDAVAAGQAYVALDSSAADSNYFFRQIQYLAADSMYARAAEFAAAGAAKFPRSASMLLAKASNERRAGQLPAAKASLQRALEIDPKAPGANMLLAQIANDLGSTDEAIKAVQADVAVDPTNKERDAQFLFGLGSAQYKAAVASKKVEDFQKAITILQASDAIAPSANAKFFTAVSAFSVAQTAAANLQTANKTCTDAKLGQDALVLVSTNMPGGGSVSPENAKAILGALPQFQPFFDASVKKYCK